MGGSHKRASGGELLNSPVSLWVSLCMGRIGGESLGRLRFGFCVGWAR